MILKRNSNNRNAKILNESAKFRTKDLFIIFFHCV